MLRKFFGYCTHPRISWPLTIKGVTTVSCLECGRTMLYDWDGLGALPIKAPTVTAPRRLFIDSAGMRYESNPQEGWDG
jgi:hypothetical protein